MWILCLSTCGVYIINAFKVYLNMISYYLSEDVAWGEVWGAGRGLILYEVSDVHLMDIESSKMAVTMRCPFFRSGGSCTLG